VLYRYVVTGAVPRVAQPRTFTPEELQRITVPVLLMIGTRDNLTGDPAAVRTLAEQVPDIEIHELDSGHLLGIERADDVNTLMLAFLQ
jgi:pimeloyl-ACP methyl ester carboxylesterase